jgi:RecA/RadA recombinase
MAGSALQAVQIKAAAIDLEIESQDDDKIVFDGEWGHVTVWADGRIETQVPSYEKALRAAMSTESPRAEDLSQEETIAQPIQESPANVNVASSGSIYDQIITHFGPDLLEVFGETGTMKSKGMVALASECAKAGKKVFYLDTENNLSPKDVSALRALSVVYKYTPVLTQIDDIIQKQMPAMKCDLIIIDSVGMPVLRKFSAMSAKERGTALLDIIKWLGTLKEWTFNNNSLAFVTNQPQSEFGKSNPSEKGDYRMPFGDKSNFIPGALLLSKKTLDSSNGSKAVFQVFRCRDHAVGEKIFQIEAGKAGSSFKMVVALHALCPLHHQIRPEINGGRWPMQW